MEIKFLSESSELHSTNFDDLEQIITQDYEDETDDFYEIESFNLDPSITMAIPLDSATIGSLETTQSLSTISSAHKKPKTKKKISPIQRVMHSKYVISQASDSSSDDGESYYTYSDYTHTSDRLFIDTQSYSQDRDILQYRLADLEWSQQRRVKMQKKAEAEDFTFSESTAREN